ncbi:MAG: pseudouridine synthase [Verrucomicrobiota bacterium]|jgi:16S rRNA pseudouridine516 synthase|nr:MAG: rRNA pseudouridine synthase [Verrucomicrobiota bacterium]
MRRLDQLLSNLGYCSRREARGWINQEMVKIKGVLARDADQRCNESDVTVEDQPLDNPDGLLLILNKPLGHVCSHDIGEGARVYDLLPERWQRRNPIVTSVGRLDQDTTGLILLTDQSMLVHKLTSPKHKVPKVYRATLDKEVNEAERNAMVILFASGNLLLSGETEPCLKAELKWLTGTAAELTIIEGRYHQVRRMFASQGYTVTALHRTRFGSLELGELALGTWRLLPLNQSFT